MGWLHHVHLRQEVEPVCAGVRVGRISEERSEGVEVERHPSRVSRDTQSMANDVGWYGHSAVVFPSGVMYAYLCGYHVHIH